MIGAFGAFDDVEQQCLSLGGEDWLGFDTTVRSVGRLPTDLDELDPREVHRRGPHGEVIVPLISLYDRVEWSDGVATCAEDPFARVRTAEEMGVGALPPRWTIEHDDARRKVRVVVDGAPRAWHDFLDGLRWTEPGAPEGGRRWGYVARDGATVSVVLDDRVVDTFPARDRGVGRFDFSADGRLFFWTAETDTTKAIDAHGNTRSYPCATVSKFREITVGARGVALDCLFGGSRSTTIVTSDGEAHAFAHFGGNSLNSWWMSEDREHLVTHTNRWLIVDGVRGPEADRIWDVQIDERQREVRYLAIVKSVTLWHPERDVVAVTMRWPDAFCGEPFLQWRYDPL